MTTTPIMPQLKSATQALHDATENGTFNKRLVMGELPRTAYVELLEQFFIIHRTLETCLRDALATRPAWREVVRDYQFQEPYLREDLTFLGANIDAIKPQPSTAAFVALIHGYADANPAALLGTHYVFEGSNNGSRYIARALRKAYDLTTEGVRYFDPYGEQQPEYWQAFKKAMNQIEWSAEDTAEMIAAAGAAFEATGRLHEDMGKRHGDESKAAPSQSSCPAMRPS